MTHDFQTDKMVFDEFQGALTICGPSHLEKRARYHLIKGGVCAGFAEGCQPFSLSELPEALNLPRIFFSDLHITKMNEKLPRKLFAIANIWLCLSHELIKISLYLFPLFLFDAAIFEEKVLRWDRLVLFETSLIYFVMIRDWLDSINQGNTLPERQTASSHCVMEQNFSHRDWNRRLRFDRPSGPRRYRTRTGIPGLLIANLHILMFFVWICRMVPRATELMVFPPLRNFLKPVGWMGEDGAMTRVITIGDSGVGKTALIHRLKTGQFLDSTTPTVGAGVTVIEFEADQLKYSFQLWDTAGQELYRNIIPICFRGASPDIGIVLVGSKCDDNAPAVNESEVRKFAEIHQLKHFFISSLTSQNISCLMDHIRVALITKRNLTDFQSQNMVLAVEDPKKREGGYCRK
jgi:signal recognition particle receptor subunit beta